MTEHKTTHAVEAKARLLEQFKGKARLLGIIDALSAQTQVDEDVAWQIMVERWLSSSVGSQLDGIGEIIGEPRGGKDDETYRLYLGVRIIINLSSGTGDEVLAVASALFGEANHLSLDEFYPASMLLDASGAIGSATIETIASLLGETKCGGVNLQLLYSPHEDADTFAFSSDDTEQASTTQGWADNEYVVNGDFSDWTTDNPDGWTNYETPPSREVSQVGSGEDHSGVGTGACNIYQTLSNDPPYVRQEFSGLTVGVSYTLTFVVSYILGDLYVEDPGYAQFETQIYDTTGTKTITFVATGTAALVTFTSVATPDESTIDSVSLRRTAEIGGFFSDVLRCS